MLTADYNHLLGLKLIENRIISEVKGHPFKPKLPKIIDTGSTVIVTLFSPDRMKAAEPILSRL